MSLPSMLLPGYLPCYPLCACTVGVHVNNQRHRALCGDDVSIAAAGNVAVFNAVVVAAVYNHDIAAVLLSLSFLLQ